MATSVIDKLLEIERERSYNRGLREASWLENGY